MNAPTTMATALDADELFLASRYGPDWRAVLQIEDKPFAETNDSAFWDFFGDLSGDPAPDLTAYNRSVAGMAGVAS